MAHFILLTRVEPTAPRSRTSFEPLRKEVIERVVRDCQNVNWTANFAVLGPYDYLTVFEAPSAEVAARVSMIVRAQGNVTTEIWGAIPLNAFIPLLHDTIDEVEEADLESFPASDAPAWTGTTATRSDRDD